MNFNPHQNGKTLTVGQAELYYQEIGNPDGIPVMLLHGGFGTLADFEPIVEFFEGFRVILMDSRGQGKSTLGDEQLTYALLATDAILVLDHLGIKRVAIGGFSDGGMVANLLAINYPERIRKLVSIATPWRKEDLDLIAEPLANVTVDSWQEKFSDSYDLYQRLQPEIDFEKLVEQLKHMWLDKSQTGGYPGQRIAQIKCPTLIVRGDEDTVVTRESARLLADTIPGAMLLNLPDAGHEVHIDQATIVADFMYGFLRKN